LVLVDNVLHCSNNSNGLQLHMPLQQWLLLTKLCMLEDPQVAVICSDLLFRV
jgi:hypothetical protein